MTFDWKKFCQDYSVPYVDHGPNVAYNHITITCPFCDDPSEHMGLNLNEKTPYWSCWRCKQAGRMPGFLVSKVLKNSKLTAQALSDQETHSLDEFDNLFEEKPERKKVEELTEKKLPHGLIPVDVNKATGSTPLEYLNYRGFKKSDVEKVALRYKLHHAYVGDYAGRIVLPVYYEHKLISWTGRAMWRSTIRYKTENSGDIKKLVANYDDLLKADPNYALCICEGPFDFLKMDFYGSRNGLRATCVFGTNYSASQVNLLAKLAQRFKKTFVLFDSGAESFSMKLAEELTELSRVQVQSKGLTQGKDPGDLTPLRVKQLAEDLCKS